MINPLENLVDLQKNNQYVKALTDILGRKSDTNEDSKKSGLVELFNSIIPFDYSRLELQDENTVEGYHVPKSKRSLVVAESSFNDWTSLLTRFDSLLGNLMRLLNNMRRIEYRKIIHNKIFEKEIERRHKLLKEKILERTDDQKPKKKLSKEEKISKLKNFLMSEGFATGVGLTAANVVLTTISLNGSAKEKGAQVAKRLMSDLGLTDFQAAGIVGNLLNEGMGKGIPDDIEDGAYIRETGPPPDYGTMSVGYGWAQWTNGGNNGPNDRLNKFIIRLGGGPGKPARAATDSDNYSYLLDDFRGPYANVLQSLKATTNITDAASVILTQYERPANQSQSVIQHRANTANTILQEMKKASGGIVSLPNKFSLPELFDTFVGYDSRKKSTTLSKFIVDKPTVISLDEVGEPLVIIPLGRPIGRMVLKTIFGEPFRKIDRYFLNLFRQQQDQDEDEVVENVSRTVNLGETKYPTVRNVPILPDSLIGGVSPAAPINHINDFKIPSLFESKLNSIQFENRFDNSIFGDTIKPLDIESYSKMVPSTSYQTPSAVVSPQYNFSMNDSIDYENTDTPFVSPTIIPLQINISPSEDTQINNIIPSPSLTTLRSRIDNNITQRKQDIMMRKEQKVTILTQEITYVD